MSDAENSEDEVACEHPSDCVYRDHFLGQLHCDACGELLED